MKTIQETYAALVKNEHPENLHALWEDLNLPNWPPDHNYDLTLRPASIISILQRYLSGTLTPAQVEDWANYMEALSFSGRIGAEFIDQTIYCLANPVLEGALTPHRAKALCNVLATSSAPSAEEINTAYA